MTEMFSCRILLSCLLTHVLAKVTSMRVEDGLRNMTRTVRFNNYLMAKTGFRFDEIRQANMQWKNEGRKNVTHLDTNRCRTVALGTIYNLLKSVHVHK
jgi:hypothetical protein